MKEVILTYPTPEGSQEIRIESERTSFGRGSDSDYRLADEGLSRLNSTIYRDGDRIWIVDENSTNGTFVNGEAVSPSGTPLYHGDTIKIGNSTYLKVRISEKQIIQSQATGQAKTAAASASEAPAGVSGFLPIIIAAVAIFVISVSAVFIVISASGLGSGNTEVVKKTATPDEDDPRSFEEKTPKRKSKDSPTPASSPDSTPGDPGPTDQPTPASTPIPAATPALPPGKKYTELSDGDKSQYVQVKAEKVASLIGNRGDTSITPLAVQTIKADLNAYATRIKAKPRTGSCGFGDNLQVTYERASKNAPFIIKSFNSKGIDPKIGLYLAMIESEHCICLQSPTGPLGMFQFAYLTAVAHFPQGSSLVKGAKPPVGDDRCKPEMAAQGAASYMRALTVRFGTGPSSVPMAIGSYNSGEAGLSNNMGAALNSNEGLPRDFWTLIANREKLSKQFQSENFKYVPKFFAAAIIGENPADFGLTLQPLSTYTQ